MPHFDAWQDLEPNSNIFLLQEVSPGLNVCHHVHHPGLLLLLLPICLSCPCSAQEGARHIISKHELNE